MTTTFAELPIEQTSAATRAPSLAAGWAVHDIDAPLGALVTGIDARLPLRAEQALAIKRAWVEHHVVVLPDQHLDDAQFLRLARTFGDVFQPPSDVPVLASDPYGGNTPAIVKVSNVEDGVLGNHELTAHADHHWTPVPSSGSFLYALEVPTKGGDTTWIDLIAAYEELDAATQREIEELQLITYNPFLRRLKPLASGKFPHYRTPDIEALAPFVVHPLVRTHPESGRKLLYLDAATEVELVGVEATRGQALVEKLREHLLHPRFGYTHRWQVGDLVWWDNQATLHARTAFDPSERRVLKRISLSGSRPF